MAYCQEFLFFNQEDFEMTKSNINLNDIVFIKSGYDTQPEDIKGFKVLGNVPDKSGTIPVQRVSDSEYACLPIEALESRTRKIRGKFWKTTFGTVYFAVEKPLYAATIGFRSQGFCDDKISMRHFETFVSDYVEVELV